MKNVNFTSFLCQRELGLSSRHWKQIQQTDECLERHACTPEVNQPCALSGQCRATFLMDFSPDGTKVASTHGDHTVRVTELTTGKCTHILAGHPRTPWCLAFHPSSNQILASGCLDGEVRIWDLQGGGSEVWRSKDNLVVASLTFHPVDHVLVFAVGNKIYFWDWHQAEPFAICQSKHEYERIRLVRFDSVGHFLYTGIANNTMVQQASSRVSFINGRNNPATRPQRTQQLSNVYSNLVECFQAYRRDRVMNEGAPAQGSNTEDAENTEAQEVSTARDRSRSRSPVHEEGLNYARQYAAHVTEVTQRSPRHDHEINPADVQPNSGSDTVHLINDGVPHFMAPRPFAWSPPPRGASQADEVGDIIIDEEDRGQTSSDSGQRSYDFSRRSSDLHQRSFELGQRVSALLQRSEVLRRGTPDRVSRSRSPDRVSRSRSRHVEMRPVTILDSGHNVRSTTTTPINPILTDRCRNCTESTAGESSSRSNVVAVERNNETGAMNVESYRVPSILPSNLRRAPVLGTDSLRQAPVLGTDSLGRAPVLGTDSLQRAPVLSTDSLRRAPVLGTDSLRRAPVLRTDSHSGAVGLHGADCDSRDCEVCGSFNRSQYGRWESSSTRATAPNSLHRRRFSHARSAFSQPSHTYRQRYRLLHPSRVHVNSYAPNPGHQPAVTMATSQSPVDTHVASSQTSSVGVTQEGQTTTPGEEQLATLGEEQLTTPGERQTTIPGERQLTTPGNRQPSSLQNRLSSLLQLASQAQPGIIIQSSQLNSLLQTHRSNESDNETVGSSQLHSLLQTHRSNESDNETVGSSQLNSLLQTHRSNESDNETVGSSQLNSLLQTHRSNESDNETVGSSQLNSLLQTEDGHAVDTEQISGQLHSVLETSSEQSNTAEQINSGENNTAEQVNSGENNTAEQVNSGENNTAEQVNSGENNNGQGYRAIQDNFATITARIESEMDELDRRITSLRNSFHRSIQQLQQDRDNYLISRQSLSPSESQESAGIVETAPPPAVGPSLTNPLITITRCREGRARTPPPSLRGGEGSGGAGSSPPNLAISESGSQATGSRSRIVMPRPLLETALRSTTQSPPPPVPGRSRPPVLLDAPPRGSFPSTFALPPTSHSWHSLQRHHLHPHYSVSILDDTINRPNDALQTAINRAIAGAFMGRGEPAVASNIINQTHRIQAWDFTKCTIPDITDATVGMIVPHCKIHNDASCDISRDCSLLGTFVPSHRGFPDDNILAIFSLMPESRGQCLFTKSFGPNAISVSISPKTNFVMVGLAAKRLSWVFTANQLVAQVYKMDNVLAGEKSTKHVSDIMHPCDMDIRAQVSVNSARWLPGVGDGIIYGTNRGHLHICRPGAKKESEKEKPNDTTTSGTSIRRNLMHMLGLSSTAVPLISIGTQTAERRSAATQTE